MFCENCGAPNKDNAVFCQSCGTAMTPEDETTVMMHPEFTPPADIPPVKKAKPPKAPKAKKTSKKTLWIALTAILLALACAVGGALLLFYDGFGSDSQSDEVEEDVLDEDIVDTIAVQLESWLFQSDFDDDYPDDYTDFLSDYTGTKSWAELPEYWADSYTYDYDLEDLKILDEDDIDKLNDALEDFDIELDDALSLKIKLTDQDSQDSTKVTWYFGEYDKNWYLFFDPTSDLFDSSYDEADETTTEAARPEVAVTESSTTAEAPEPKPAVATEATATTEATTATAVATTTERVVDDTTIKIAVIGNTSGTYSKYGTATIQGILLYFDVINDQGGINGKLVEPLVFDDQGDSGLAVDAFYQAYDQGAVAVVGSVLTGASIAVADVAYAENIPMFNATCTATGLIQLNADNPSAGIRENVFRSSVIDAYQGQRMADFATEMLGASTAALLIEEGSAYSTSLADAFIQQANNKGISIVDVEYFASGDTDFTDQMAAITNANPDVFFAPIYYGEAATAITTGREMGLSATFLGCDGFGGISSYGSASVLENTYYCSGYSPDTDMAIYFANRYENAYGESVPNMFAPLGYDAAVLLCQGLAYAESKGLTQGSDNYSNAVIQGLEAISGFQGITGMYYGFDQYHNPIKTMPITMVTGGQEVLFVEY